MKVCDNCHVNIVDTASYYYFSIVKFAFRILLMYGEKKKLAHFESVPEVTVGLLKDAAKNLFALKDEELVLQTYDKSFDEYIDAEDHVVVLDGDKVRMVVETRALTSAPAVSTEPVLPPLQQSEFWSSPTCSSVSG